MYKQSYFQQVKFQNLFRDGENEGKHYPEITNEDPFSDERHTVMTEGLWSIASIMEQYTEKYLLQRVDELSNLHKPWSIKSLMY